jgi:hypothetical protein
MKWLLVAFLAFSLFLATVPSLALTCSSDADCWGKIVCPQVIGYDTPRCINTQCTCGSSTGATTPSQPIKKVFYPRETYSKVFVLVPNVTLREDTDYTDGQVVYIYRIDMMYSDKAGVFIIQNQQELSSITANTPIQVTLSYTVPDQATAQKYEGNVVAGVALVKLVGTFDYSTGQWNWSYETLSQVGDTFEIRSIPSVQPPPTNWFLQIFQAIISFLKRLFGLA